MSRNDIVPGLPEPEYIDTRTDGEKIKERQIAYMTAAVIWFVMLLVMALVTTGLGNLVGWW